MPFSNHNYHSLSPLLTIYKLLYRSPNGTSENYESIWNMQSLAIEERMAGQTNGRNMNR